MVVNEAGERHKLHSLDSGGGQHLADALNLISGARYI